MVAHVSGHRWDGRGPSVTAGAGPRDELPGDGHPGPWRDDCRAEAEDDERDGVRNGDPPRDEGHIAGLWEFSFSVP